MVEAVLIANQSNYQNFREKAYSTVPKMDYFLLVTKMQARVQMFGIMQAEF